MPLLARLTQAKRPLALIAPPHLPYAPALRQHGVALSKLTVVDTTNDHDALWASEELLRARAGAVLLRHATIVTNAPRRLHLAAATVVGLTLVYRPPQRTDSSTHIGMVHCCDSPLQYV